MPAIRDVLRNPKSFDLRFALYAAKPVVDLDADCLVLDPNDVEDDDDEEPAAARNVGYQYVLMMNDVNGIITNLLQQVPNPSDELRLQAFQFYFARDAYIAV